MAINKWVPKALAVAQKNTITIGGGPWVAGETVTITINTKDLVITIGTLITTAQVATTIYQAFESVAFTDTTASVTPAGGKADITEHNELTAAAPTASVVTLTGNVRGTPHTITVTETSTLGTAVLATTVTATGPNDVNNGDNWSLNTIPIAGDDVLIENSSVSLLDGFSAIVGTLPTFTVKQSFTGDVGRPQTNPLGYPEYRGQSLAIDATLVNIGSGEGSGSGRIILSLGTVQSAITVENTGAPSEFGLPACILSGTNALNTLDVNQGSVGIGVIFSQVSTIATGRLGSGSIEFGSNVTLGTFDVWQSSVIMRSNITALTCSAGNVRMLGTMTVGTLTITGGTVNYLSSGAITTLVVGGSGGGTLDLSEDTSVRNITNATLVSGGQIIDPLQTANYANGIIRGADVTTVSAS